MDSNYHFTAWSDDAYCIFKDDIWNSELQAYRELIRTVELQGGISVIADHAFYNCTSLEEIVLPEGLEEIRYGAFSWCSGLRTIELPEAVIRVEEGTFKECTGLETVVFKGKVQYIGKEAFKGCTALKEIRCPEYTITSVKEGAFNGCGQLKSLSLADNFNGFDTEALKGCTSFSDIYYGGSAETWTAVYYSDNEEIIKNVNMHYAQEGDTFDIYTIDYENELQELKTEKSNVNNYWTMYSENLLVLWGEGYANKPSDDFGGFNIRWVIVEDGIETLDEGIFERMSLLKVYLADSVQEIGKSAFLRCSELKEIRLPANLTKIGNSAFAGCDSLTDVYYPGSEEQWNQIAIDEGGNDALKNAEIHFESEK